MNRYDYIYSPEGLLQPDYYIYMSEYSYKVELEEYILHHCDVQTPTLDYPTTFALRKAYFGKRNKSVGTGRNSLIQLGLALNATLHALE